MGFEQKLNYQFKDPKLLKQALTHPSMVKNTGTVSYERLEFLGDKILGAIISEELFKQFPTVSEGELSLYYSNLVRTSTLAVIAAELELGDAIIMDYGEIKHKGRQNVKNLENALEAVIGALHLDGGYEITKSFILNYFMPYISNSQQVAKDYKSKLQEWAQKIHKQIPEYTMLSQEGFAHDPIFNIAVNISGLQNATGSGKSKKIAEQEAAKKMLEIAGVE